MIRRVLKYPLRLTEVQGIALPASAIIRAVRFQGDTPCIWAEVANIENGTKLVDVYIVGTGMVIDPRAKQYVATMEHGPFVWHVYLGA